MRHRDILTRTNADINKIENALLPIAPSYKILTIPEKDLQKQLNDESINGFEVFMFIEKIPANSYNDIVAWKVLLRSIKK